MEEIFGLYGKIKSVEYNSGGTGSAFITYEKSNDAEEADVEKNSYLLEKIKETQDYDQ